VMNIVNIGVRILGSLRGGDAGITELP
jgi:hypothetical protein